MKVTAEHQPAGNIGGLQKSAFGWRVGCQIARDCDEDVPALRRVAPLAKLSHACLEHLVGMKPCILAQECLGERRDQRLGRMTQSEIAGNKARSDIDLLLAVEGIEQSGADVLLRD